MIVLLPMNLCINGGIASIVVVRPISINFSELIDIPSQHGSLCGVTKLRNKIYALSQTRGYHNLKNLIRVFEDRNPFRLLDKIEVTEFGSLFDIGSSEKENCLYVADRGERCVWKITTEADDQYNIVKWLNIDYWLDHACTLSVSSLGNLLVVGKFLFHLNIYGSDAEYRSIQLPRDTRYPIHAVETLTGSFIILHELKETEEEGVIGQRTRVRGIKYVVSELS